MPRPRKNRRIRFDPKVTYFKPRGIPLSELEEITLTPDETEALRLKFHQNLQQTEAAAQMDISQSTFQRILSSAQQKISLAITEGKAIRIEKA